MGTETNALTGELGRTQNAKASRLATKFEGVSAITLDLFTKKSEVEGGQFAVMFNLTGQMDAETLAALPDPNAKTGNNPAWYKAPKVQKDGKEKLADFYFYDVLALSLPAVIAKQARIDLLARSMGDAAKVNQSDIPDDVKNMAHGYRKSEISRLTDSINYDKNVVAGAFELYFQMKAVSEYPAVTMEVQYALDPKGKLMDGMDNSPTPDKVDTDGNPAEGFVFGPMQVERVKKPITITTTQKGRAKMDTTEVGIGTFKKYDVAKAAEKGTYQSLIDTAKKVEPVADPNASTLKPKAINTVETFLTTLNDLSEFLHRAQESSDRAAWQAIDKALHGTGTDDAFYNTAYVEAAFKSLVGSPNDGQRYATLLNNRAELVKKVA